MRRLPELVVAAAMLLSMPLSAQEPTKPPPSPEEQNSWQQPLDGLAAFLASGNSEFRVLVVSPQTDEKSVAVEQMVLDELRRSSLVALVMDDSPLGDIAGKSDEELLVAAKPYPADAVVLLRTFPNGADDVNVVVRIESTNGPQSFHMSRGAAPPWKRPAKPVVVEPSPDPNVLAAQQAAESGRQEATLTSMGAVGVAETLLLVDAENQRRRLTLEAHPRSPVVRGPDEDVVAWPQAYDWMDRADLASRYRGRRAVRIGLLAGGGTIAAGGLGLLFVGLANQVNCKGETTGCGRPTFLIAGGSMLGAGLLSLVTGTILRPQPVPTDQIETLVDDYNLSLDR